MSGKKFLICVVLLLVGLGISSQRAEADEKPIVFGGALPLTGWGSDAGEYNHRGYVIWEKMINEQRWHPGTTC